MSHWGIIYKLREVLGQVQGAFYTFDSLDTEIKMFGNEPEWSKITKKYKTNVPHT